MALLKQYDDFLLNNASQITAVESSLRSITYFLPGRFKDAELAGETIYASLNLLGLYHDSILARALEKQNPLAITNDKALAAEKRVLPSSAARLDTNIATGLTPSEHARYTNHFSHSSKSYNRVARSLVIVGYFELLAEMVARRKLGRRKAWDVVAAIEALKVLLRLSLVQMTGSRMAIHPPIPEREVDPAALEQERANIVGKLAHRLDVATASSNSSLSNSITQPPKGYWKGSRTGLLRPTLASLRPGYDDTEDDPPASAAQPDRRPPHLRAMRINAAHSGSDTDDTLVDSTRLQASTTLYPSAASDDPLSQSSNALQKDLPSPPVTMKPWSESQINDYLLSRVLTVNDVRKPEELVRPLRNRSAHLAEVVWILRPLIYVLALRRWGRKATLPFALSFALEYFAKELRIRSFAPSIPAPKSLFPTNPLLAAMMGQNPLASILTSIFMGGNPADKAKRPISSVEEAEWSKRANSFWWYLLRGPLWYSFTRPKLSGLVQRTHGKFLIGMVGGVLSDYLPLIDEYYYYSAT